MKTKKVLSLTLAAVMAASLTACGGGSTEADTICSIPDRSSYYSSRGKSNRRGREQRDRGSSRRFHYRSGSRDRIWQANVGVCSQGIYRGDRY